MSGENFAVQCTGVSFRFDQKLVLSSLDFAARYGQLTALVGPNGAGKSTLLKCCLGLLKPTSGTIQFNDNALFGATMPDSRLAYVPQRESVDWDFPLSVFDVAAQGRAHTLGIWGSLSKKNRAFVFECAVQRQSSFHD
jgi:manganese/zinc/iron transport system ATP- binding protein